MKSIKIIFSLAIITLFSVTVSLAQESTKSFIAAAPKLSPDASVVMSPYKVQAEGLLESIKEANNSDMAGYAMKAENYIAAELEDMKVKRIDNTESFKKKETLFAKSKTIAKNAKNSPDKAKTELVKLLEDYIKTF